MARQIRIQFPGAHYHVIARGERKDRIFKDNHDFNIFIQKLQNNLIKYNIRCISFCLMPNHYHLYLVTEEANLSKAMHQLNSSYTNWYKKKHQITGHIFQGRYKAILIDKENYSNAVIDYIHLNPVKKSKKKKCWEYSWSSAAYYCGESDAFSFVDTSLVMSEENLENKIKYKHYIDKKRNFNLPHRDIFKGIALGKDDFKNKVDEYLKTRDINIYLPSTRMTKTRSADKIFDILSLYFDVNKSVFTEKKNKNFYRKLSIYILKKFTRLKNIEIGDIYGVSPSTISDIIRNFKENTMNDDKIKNDIRNIEIEFRRPDPK
ncbi:MAG: transposase [Candidatus Muirbacterium halophilum]|nr:transposase [Candidatus Muirbacterium halophilum]MCK9477232.1 transposase [Candidatus Muirbacterium halophilum]